MASFKNNKKEEIKSDFVEKIEAMMRQQAATAEAEKKARIAAGDPGSRDLTDQELKVLHQAYKNGMDRFNGKAAQRGAKNFSEVILLRRLVQAIEELDTAGPHLGSRQAEVFVISSALHSSSKISPRSKEYCGMIAGLLKPPIPKGYGWHFVFRIAAKIKIFFL